MKIKSIIFILIASFSMSYAFFGSKDFVVIYHDAPIYTTFMDNNSIGSVDLGVPINIKSRKGARVQFEHQNQLVWIDQQYISELKINAKDFSSTSKSFYPMSVVSEESVCFVYNNRLYTLNITEPNHLQAKIFGNIPRSSQISASEDRKMLFLTGDIVSNNTTYLNLAFYNVIERKFYPLTFFLGNQIMIESSEFSQDGRYLSLVFDVDGMNVVHIYDVISRKLLFTKRDILNVSWYRSRLFLSTPHEIIYYTDLEKQKHETLYTFDKSTEVVISHVIIAGEYFLQIQGVIYHFDHGILQKTDFNSLERSPKGFIEHYSRGEQFLTYYKGQRLRNLSGEKPRWTFLSILDDENILYKYNKDAIQMLSIYNLEQDKSYVYYWVEEPFHTFKSGVSVEFVTEGEDIWLFLEKADDFVKSVRIQDIIN